MIEEDLKNNETSNLIVGLLIILTLISLISLGPFYDYQSLVLFVLFPLLFLIAMRTDWGTIGRNNKEILVYTFFVLGTLTTVFYKPNFEFFITAFNGLLGGLIASYVPIGLNKKLNKNYENYFHYGFILSILLLLLIEYSLGNISIIGFASELASRHRFFFNANYYSYISFFASFSLFYLHLKNRNILTTICLVVFPVLMIILAFITQSRSGLLFLVLINAIYWFLILKSHNKNIIRRLVKFVLIMAITFYAAKTFIDIYSNSQIQKRVSSAKDDSREVLINEALTVFYENPLTGVGLGQFKRYSTSKQFSHNSFVEGLAEHGILGGILVLILFIGPLIKSVRLLLQDKSNEHLRLNLLFFFTFILYNNIYVFYKVSFAMIYFFLIVSLQNRIKPKNL